MPSQFPEFLTPAFDPHALAVLESTIVVIDPLASILWVNPAWDRFAADNGAHDYVGHRGSYLDGIAQPLRDFYRAVFSNALETGEVFEQEYECSSPDVRRIFHLRALPVEGRGMLIEHSLVVEGAHEGAPEEPAEARYLGRAGLIIQCSNCRRVRRGDTHAWDRVPRWVERPHPKTSHGICPSCVGWYWGLWRGAKR